jgi:hypothetical protein
VVLWVLQKPLGDTLRHHLCPGPAGSLPTKNCSRPSRGPS